MNNRLLELVKEQMNNLSADVSADTVKTLYMARIASIENAEEISMESVLEYARNHADNYAVATILAYSAVENGNEADKALATKTYEKLLADIENVDTSVPEKALEVLPFYIQAETYLGKKEHYQDVTVRFNAAVAKFEENVNAKDAATLLMALATAYELMSEQLFEHYMAVAQNFKKILKATTDMLLVADASVKAEAAFAVYRAMDMKILLAEKYEDLANNLLA